MQKSTIPGIDSPLMNKPVSQQALRGRTCAASEVFCQAAKQRHLKIQIIVDKKGLASH